MAQISGHVTVTTAGTAVQFPSSVEGTRFAIKAHPDNTDTVWVGQGATANDVDASSGFPLNPGETIVRKCVNLSGIWADADVSGEKVCWILLE